MLFFTRHHDIVTKVVPWFTIGEKTNMIGFTLDDISTPMIVVTSIISFLVHVYSIGYMADDSRLKRYFGILGLFTFSMLGLVMSNNILITFCFWELIGFSSYLLIGHWAEREEAGAAATKASLMNRIGDISFLILVLMVWSYTGTMEYSGFYFMQGEINLIASLLLFIAVMAKSAQLPLFTWLPDAMEGPTPVSALLHSATMVAAGVFLLIRFSVVFDSPQFILVASVVGSLTAIAGAVAALFHYDIKKILAYSTISQLGFMVMSTSGQLSYAHMLNHAFFKAGLFLAAGAIIHALHQSQHTKDVNDIRYMGSLRKQMPYTFICFVIFAASLSGLPFTSGFVSKELILSHPVNEIIRIAAWTVTFLTPLYVFRLIWYIFSDNHPSNSPAAVQEVPGIMKFPLIILAIASLSVPFSGDSFSFTGLSSLLLSSHESADWTITIVSVLVIAGAIGLSYFLYRDKPSRSYPEFLTQNYFLDKLYNIAFVKPVLGMSRTSEFIDNRWIDRTLHRIAYAQVAFSHAVGWGDRMVVDGTVNGLAKLTKSVGSLSRSFTNGKIQSYMIWAMLALIIFIFLMIYQQ